VVASPAVGAPRVGWFAALVGTIGARFIYVLIRVFGRARRRTDIGWLVGPLGGKTIGDAAYREVAEAEGLTIEREARHGGLVPSFDQLRSPSFDPARVQPLVREFYEHTTEFAMDVWSKVYFPASIALWLLVKTISRQVNQLNFPLSPLDTAKGIVSEIISLRRADGSVRYTGWFRTLVADRSVLYTGFYMTETAPGPGVPCVKVVFPMPSGNATVVLRPALQPDGSLILDSSGKQFGDAGFYRMQRIDDHRLRVWQIKTLKERFHVYVDDTGVLRCDHEVRFLGLPVLTLHYKIFRRGASAAA
jgi:hypothetical protein